MLMRRIVEGVGRFLTGAGVLILLFVAYELWGTGLHEARSQKSLRKDLHQVEQYFDHPPSTTTTVTTPPGQPAPAPVQVPVAPAGNALGIIRIPKIGVNKAIVQGVGVPDLKKGPGHYPTTPMPGQHGNVAIAGHRTTYGAPFNQLDRLGVGDQIFIATKQGAFEYDVTEKKVIKPSESSVLRNTDDNRLTLTTCNPKYSASQRLIVIAALKGEVVPGSSVDSNPPTTTTVNQPTTTALSPSTTVAKPSSLEPAGLSGKRSGAFPAVMWGFLSALVFIGILIASHLWRKWPSYILGTPIFLVVLFIFFESFSRFVPSNI
jgi:sortase A